MLSSIRLLKLEHPCWGYRRVWAYLRYRMNLDMNKKRIYRLMKEEGLLVRKNERLRASRYVERSKPVAERPNQYWGIDMTKVMSRYSGWVYLVVVLDWYTKEIVGYSVSARSKTEDWLEALNKAVNCIFPEGIREGGYEVPMLISDNGCQPTSVRFMKECSALGIRQIFTSWSNPRRNADTERVIRTIKKDAVWPYEWDSIGELREALALWIGQYNTDYPHSSLNYRTPEEYRMDYETEANTKLFCS